MPDGTLFDTPAGDSLPPHNITAEQALLGSMFYDNETYNRVAEFLLDEHFYDPVHARLFEQASGVIRRGDVADAITLTAFAEADPGMKELGGADYLVELTGARVSSAAARDYAKIIYDLALRRGLIRIGGDIEQEATADVESPAPDLIAGAERKLFELAEKGSSSKNFVTFADALAETIDNAAAAFERDGGLSGIASGLTDLDQRLGGLHPSDLIILAGRPSMGKTALATNIAMNIAKKHRVEVGPDGEKKTVDGGVVGFFSLEMSAEQLALRLLADQARISSHRVRRGDIEPHEFEQIRDAAMDIANAPLHIDDTGGISIAALCARARRLKRTHGLDLLVIDYLQLVTPSASKGAANRVQEVSEVTQALKALAKELEVPVIALSQLSRQVEQRDDKRPQLADLRESGSIEQDADVVMFVYREAYYVGRREPKSKEGTDEYAQWQEEMARAHGRAEIILGKQRHGPIGTVEVAFEEQFTRFSDLVKDQEFDAPQRFQDRVGAQGANGGPGV